MNLMPHQIEALEFMEGKTGAAIFYTMGLGKTLIMLERLFRLQQWPALIVCPLSVVSVWAKEAEKHGFKFSFSEVIGPKEKRKERLYKVCHVYVINYEGLRVMESELLKKDFKVIVLDESHRAKNVSATQTQIAVKLADKTGHVYCLSGTPVTNSPEDIWPQIHMVNREALGSWYYFKNNFVEYRTMQVRTPGGMREIKKAMKFKNRDQLKTCLSKVAIRKTKEECVDLPEKIYKKVFCLMEPAQKKMYYSLKSDLKLMIEEKRLCITSAATMLTKLNQVLNGFVYTSTGNASYLPSCGKIKMLDDLLKDIDDKTIIFTQFVAEIKLITDLLKEINRPYVVYDGDSAERQEVVDKFYAGEKNMVFVAAIEKAKEGITLTCANNVIYYGNSYSYATRKQSEDRAHRIGQRRSVVYHDLIHAGCVDERILAAIERKERLADAVTDDSIRLAMQEVADMPSSLKEHYGLIG